MSILRWVVLVRGLAVFAHVRDLFGGAGSFQMGVKHDKEMCAVREVLASAGRR